VTAGAAAALALPPLAQAGPRKIPLAPSGETSAQETNLCHTPSCISKSAEAAHFAA